MRLKSSKYLRTFSLSLKVRRSYEKRVHANTSRSQELGGQIRILFFFSLESQGRYLVSVPAHVLHVRSVPLLAWQNILVLTKGRLVDRRPWPTCGKPVLSKEKRNTYFQFSTFHFPKNEDILSVLLLMTKR